MAQEHFLFHILRQRFEVFVIRVHSSRKKLAIVKDVFDVVRTAHPVEQRFVELRVARKEDTIVDEHADRIKRRAPRTRFVGDVMRAVNFYVDRSDVRFVERTGQARDLPRRYLIEIILEGHKRAVGVFAVCAATFDRLVP